MVKNTSRSEVLKGLAQAGLAVSLLLLAARIAPVLGQEFRGLILGQVTDHTGAVVSNATVIAIREGTQQTYMAQTSR
jgi:hypothetical protein